MDDADVVRLEERIAHSEAMSQARLDLAIARIDGKLDLIIDRLGAEAAATRELSERVNRGLDGLGTRIDGLGHRIDGLETRIDGMGTRIDGMGARTTATTRAWGQWIIGTVVAIGLTMGGLLIGLKQVWIGGLQVGEALQTTAAPGPERQHSP